MCNMGSVRRVCYGCGKGYPLTEKHFECVRRTAAKRYFRHWCRTCYRERRKGLPGREAKRAYNRRYYRQHRDEIIAKIRRKQLSAVYAAMKGVAGL